MADLVLDAGALIGVERASRRMTSLLQVVRADGGLLVVPAAALAQVWRTGARQARLSRLLSDERTVVEPLDEHGARAAGALCGRVGTTDVVDASVVVAARRRGAPIATSDVGDLTALDPGAALIPV